MTASMRSRWPAAGLVGLAYFAMARLSLFFAIPPGYAVAAWPAAGVAVAALWLEGLELWPGIWLGSFAANAAMASSRGMTGTAPVLLAAWIGAGSAAQAAIAAALVRRATEGRDPLAEERDLFRFLIVAGPVACLVASLWATAGLLAFGMIAGKEAAYSWATWWVGDSIGVAFAAPLVLLWSGRGPAGSRRGKSAVTAVLFATLAAIFAIHAYWVRNDERSARAETRHRLDDAAAGLRAGLAADVDAVRSAADLFESVPNAGRAEFSRFARATLRRHPSLLALEWRPRVPDARRAEFERAERPIAEMAGPGRVRPCPRAAEYFPILYVEPVAGNEKALGLDVGRASPIRAALDAALKSGRPAASAGVKLVQETRDATSIAILAPVARPDGGVAGVVEGVIRVEDTVRALLAGAAFRGVRVEDVTEPGPARLLFAGGDVPGAGNDVARIDDEIGGRRWLIELTAPASRPRAEQSWLVLMRAFLLMYLTSWVALTLYGRAERVTRLVEEKTAELREQERRLMRAQKMESVGRLAGGIAHEFNNILMGASGLAQLALASLGPKHPSAPDLEGIVASIKRASHLVSQLLTYSRRREARVTAMDLNGLVGESLKMLSAALGRRVTMKADVAVAPLWVMADAGQVEQVLMNLCFNARDAVGGKGRIRVSTRLAVADGELAGAFIPAVPGRYGVLEVSDDGPGIPADVMPRLAEPFFTTKPFGEGTGLGPSVVSGIVRQHGGGLKIRTSPSTGTSIEVYWPAADAPDPSKTPAPADPGPRGSGHVLIVDDEPLMRSTLARILSGYGYRTTVAAGGEEALRIIETTPGIDGVVLDLMMPGMDGLETYDRLIRLRPGLKVLFLSGYAPQATADEMARRGLAFLAKPAEPARLAAALSEVLR